MKRILLTILLGALMAPFAMSQGYDIGDEAANFNLKNVDETHVSLSDYSEKEGVIVIFTCNHCPYAQAYEQRIIDIDKKFASKGYPVIAISPNDPELVPEDSFENMQKRAKNKNYPFPYLIDQEQEVYKDYGATRTPHVFVLENEGEKFTVQYIGTIDDNYKNPDKVKKTYLADAVNALLKGKEPNPEKTKAIGCTIKDKA
ncbi:MAG: thioredoxin family protein, partial [Bacteroidota bacterium]